VSARSDGDGDVLAQLARAIEPAPAQLPRGPRRTLLWLGGGPALAAAARDAAALATLDTLLRDVGATRLACSTSAGDAVDGLTARDGRGGAALALALAPELDVLAIAALDDDAATRGALRGLVIGAASVALPVLVDGPGAALAELADLPPPARAWLRAAQPGAPVPALLRARVGGAPGAAIALALLAGR
jgi:hypothetical protein